VTRAWSVSLRKLDGPTDDGDGMAYRVRGETCNEMILNTFSSGESNHTQRRTKTRCFKFVVLIFHAPIPNQQTTGRESFVTPQDPAESVPRGDQGLDYSPPPGLVCAELSKLPFPSRPSIHPSLRGIASLLKPYSSVHEEKVYSSNTSVSSVPIHSQATRQHHHPSVHQPIHPSIVSTVREKKSDRNSKHER
jgi:hypothetical protein